MDFMQVASTITPRLAVGSRNNVIEIFKLLSAHDDGGLVELLLCAVYS
jgi:hypothetical protein